MKSEFYLGLGNFSELLVWFGAGLLGAFVSQAFPYASIIYIAGLGVIFAYLISSIRDNMSESVLRILALLAALGVGFWEFIYIYKDQLFVIAFLLLILLGVLAWNMMDKLSEMTKGIGEWIVQIIHGSN